MKELNPEPIVFLADKWHYVCEKDKSRFPKTDLPSYVTKCGREATVHLGMFNWLKLGVSNCEKCNAL